MNRLALYCGVAIAVLWSATATADPPNEQANAEAVTIPLDLIWAYGMPGTRDIRSLDADKPLGIRVGGPPSFISCQGRKIAGPGFAVLGTGMEALLATQAELPEGQKPRDSFPFGSELSVVFFSHGFGYYVHVHRVERQGNVITVRYRFVPHRTLNLSSHFALIPVNELQPGKVQVNIVRSPMEQKYVDGGFKSVSSDDERRVVCKSFSFSIEK